MASWITISPEDLNDYQAAKIVTAARTKALDAGQADPFDAVMPDVINRIRDDIRACITNTVSATPLTVPPGLRSEAIYLIIESMQPRLQFALSDDLIRLIDKAEKRLARISKCEIPIEEADDPLEPSGLQINVGDVEIVGAKLQLASRQTMARL